MKRVIIVCEGETEQGFCLNVLSPFFLKKEILIHAPRIKKSMGGIVKWPEIKKQIQKHLITEPSAKVTTFIDYYGIEKKHCFPDWELCEAEVDKFKRMEILENGMKEDIADELRYRFIPYIQLHEFEGLLFTNIEVIKECVPPSNLVGRVELKEIIDTHPNPELINNNKSTSPSHRLSRIINGYNKIIYGSIIAEATGLTLIREKCLRFNNWIDEIENV